MKPSTGKKWVMKPPPEPKVDELPAIAILNCGCSCTECIENYKALILERHQTEALRESLKAEKDAMETTIGLVKSFEKENDAKIKELDLQLMAEKDKTKKFLDEVENERRVHLTNMYEYHKLFEENNLRKQDMEKLTMQMSLLNEQLREAQAENRELLDKWDNHSRIQKNVMFEMNKYEMEIRRLEEANIMIRQQLADMEQSNRSVHRSRSFQQQNNPNFSNNAMSSASVSSSSNSFHTNAMSGMMTSHVRGDSVGYSNNQSQLMQFSNSYRGR